MAKKTEKVTRVSIQVYATEEEFELVRQAALALGLSVSAWGRRAFARAMTAQEEEKKDG